MQNQQTIKNMKSIQISTIPQDNGKGKSISIVLEGELILRHLQEIAAQINDIICQHEDINIELKNIINIDLACIQLLLAAKQTAIAEKKQLSCQIELPVELRSIIKHAGLADLPAILVK